MGEGGATVLWADPTFLESGGPLVKNIAQGCPLSPGPLSCLADSFPTLLYELTLLPQGLTFQRQTQP